METGFALIDHIFVLMLENRSFDQMLGFSQIQGADAVSGSNTKIDGLTGTEANPSPLGAMIGVTTPADFVAVADPGHEFTDVREQLCGNGGNYTPLPLPEGGVDPLIKNDGFVSSFASKYPSADLRTPMKCFTVAQLPVLTTLAKEFAVCDRWFSSMPGPTWPNRFFLHAATSGGLDHSPTLLEEMGQPYSFANGTVFDLLDNAKQDWVVYAGDEFPQVLHMDGMSENLAKGKFSPMTDLANDLNSGTFSKSYVFIEPDWHPFTKFKGGNSQHPLDDVTRGEALIKEVYESVRGSPVWDRSMLIITYDEHGGFYDHVLPPTTVDPGDGTRDPSNNKNGFNFTQLGVRVPAVIVSPYIRRGTIDHRSYDHTSILATLEGRFGLTSLTQRDKQAASLTEILALKDPRTDTPSTLPAPAVSGADFGFLDRFEADFGKSAVEVGLDAGREVDPAIAGFVHVALLRKLSESTPTERNDVIHEAMSARTEMDAARYIHRVRKSIPRKP